MVKVDKELFVTGGPVDWLKRPLFPPSEQVDAVVAVGESEEGDEDEQSEKDEVEEGDLSEPLILILLLGDAFLDALFTKLLLLLLLLAVEAF